MNHVGGELELSSAPPILRRRAMLHWAQSALQQSGVAALYRRIVGVGGATVLMFHSVPGRAHAEHIDPANRTSPEVFESQMELLVLSRNVVSLDELVDRIERGEHIPAGTVVLTFDDGYLDNLENVAPVLKRLGLPATFYLATGYVERMEAQWIDQIYNAFRYRTSHVLELDGQDSVEITSENECVVYRGLVARLIEELPDGRRELLDAIGESLEPNRELPRLTMGWDDVRELLRMSDGFEIGVHTDDHIDLTHVPLDLAEEDLRNSRRRVEKETGREARHFSFPYERHDEVSRKLVRSLGVRSAARSGEDILITSETDPLALARISAPKDLSLLAFYTSGAYPGLSKLLFRRV